MAEIADRVFVLYAGQVVEFGSVETIFRAPLMPYTGMLLDSLPRLGCSSVPGYRIQAIPGNVPNATAFPRGCAFHPRCRHFEPSICDRDTPPLESAASDHLVRCCRWWAISEARDQ